MTSAVPTKSNRRDDCVFCRRSEQPRALFETPLLYVMPDKFPLVPGHILVISQAHLDCYGAASTDVHRELEIASAVVTRFLAETYGRTILVWENGVAGQSVYHAHLHHIPLPIETLPPELEAHADVQPIVGWNEVGDHYRQHGVYRFFGFGGERRLLPGHSPAVRAVSRMLAQTTGLTYGPSGWIRTTPPTSIDELTTRWNAWYASSSSGLLQRIAGK
ncbi:MAG TPA: HIT family protein [Chloroflexota bacterium]|nr:HIT family protein [Chloroflexota bacterium]